MSNPISSNSSHSSQTGPLPKNSRRVYFWKAVTWICCCCASASATPLPEQPIVRVEKGKPHLEAALMVANVGAQIIKKMTPRDFLLAVTMEDGLLEKIDIISPYMNSSSTELKDFQELIGEIQTKVADHFKFKELGKGFISKDGCKINPSDLIQITTKSSEEAYLTIGERVVQLGEADFNIHRFHSYTQIEAAKEKDGRIRLFDAYDEIRTDGKRGFFIDPKAEVLTLTRN